MSEKSGPNYWRVFLTFARNSLVRNLLFRTNFIIEAITSVSWALMNVGFYWLIFQHAPSIGLNTGWGKYEFYAFLGTTWLINSLVQTFFMPNAEEFSELIRSGGLDFALLKPIDTQFLISFRKMDWSSLVSMLVAFVLLGISLSHLIHRQSHPWVLEPIVWLLYPFYIVCGALIMYSLMTCLAATSIWLGRNQTCMTFGFISPTSRDIRWRSISRAGACRCGLGSLSSSPYCRGEHPRTFVGAAADAARLWEWPLAGFTVLATVVSLVLSRWVFQRALLSYRSASS